VEPFVFLMEDKHKTAVLDSLKNTNTFAIPRYQTGLCVRFAMRNTQQCRRGLFVTGSNTLTHNGECPWETRIHKTRLSKVMRGFHTADDDVKNRVVLEIFEENPEYFLDELVREFGIRTGRKIGTSSVRRILVNNGVKGIAEGLPSKDGSKTRSIIH